MLRIRKLLQIWPILVGGLIFFSDLLFLELKFIDRLAWKAIVYYWKLKILNEIISLNWNDE